MDEGVNESHNTDDEIHNETEPECPTLQRPDKDMDNRCCSGKLWCNRDVCGMISAATTWLLMFYAEFVVMMVILMPGVSIYPIYSYTNMTIFQTLTFLGMSSHLRTMFTNPGAIPKGNATTEMIQLMNYSDRQIIFKCTKCCSIKPDRAHHCSICQRCIRKMDHHCLWVNNCIGDNNQKYFMLFNFYIGIISTHAFSLALYHLVTCILSEWRYCTPYSPVVTVVLLLLLMAAALFFAIFTAIMFGTQLHAIWNNITGIEKLMNEQPWPVHMSRWKSTQSVFGRSSIFWFSPFTKPTINAEVESFVEFEP